MKPFALVVLIAVAGPALAQQQAPAETTVACNRHGAAITLGRRSVAPGATFYIGKTCDALRPGVGEGRWWHAASAFVVEVGEDAYRFDLELDCPSLPYCTYDKAVEQNPQ